MKKRSPTFVVLASLLTLGLYSLYWLYATTKELRKLTQRQDLTPGLDVLLTLVTFGLWGVVALTRNADAVRTEMRERGQYHVSQTVPVLMTSLASYVTGGAAWFVAMGFSQLDLNTLAEVQDDHFAPARTYRTASRARVHMPSAPRVRVETAEPMNVGASDWASSEVFASSAPAPVVF